MSTPFGFGLPEDPDESGEGSPGAGGPGPFGADNPLAALFGGGAGGPADIGAALQQLGKLLSYEGGPVNWDLAHDTARQTVAAGGDRSASEAERRAVDDAVRLAEVWLDGATALPAGTTSAAAWSRAEWVEGTLPAWQRLVEPVALKVVETAGTAIPEEMRPMAGAMVGMAQQLTGAMFGGQVGQGVGQLAGEVVTGTDVGLPLGPAGTAVLDPAEHRRVRCGARRPRGRGPALPRAARSRPPSAVLARAVARGRPARRRRRLRRGHHRRHRPARGARARHRPQRPRPGAERDAGGSARPGGHPRAAGWRWPGWRPCWRSSRAGWTPW